MIRSKAIRDYARHMPCQYCDAEFPEGHSTVVMAHSNKLEHGKGMRIKAHDCFVAALCVDCHDIVDGRALPNLEQHLRDEIWNTAHRRTVVHLMQRRMLSRLAIEMLRQNGSI